MVNEPLVFEPLKFGCSFSTDRSVAVRLSPCVGGFIFGVVLSLFVPYLSFLWCVGKTVPCDCGISWVFSFIIL